MAEPLPPPKAAEPIRLKNGIALLNPQPIAKGSFGEIYVGRIQNPIGLLAERIVRGEEDPKWLGLDDVPFAVSEVRGSGGMHPLSKPIPDPEIRKKVYAAANRLSEEYLDRRLKDRERAAEEYRDLLALLDPLLLSERDIAVKVLRPPTEKDPDLEAVMVEESLRRFLQENDMLRGLDHPGIVRRLGLVQDPKMGWCLLMDYVEGETLHDHLGKYKERRMPIAVALRRVGEIGEALQYVHSKGIIHRDLKPQNIMIREDDGRAVMMDFGIGKWADESPTRGKTAPGAKIGTPRYMAPEQVDSEVAVTKATDVYQLSTILFELVTGRAAYEGLSSTGIFKWLLDPATRHPVYVADYLPGISKELEALIEVGRDKDPEKRWSIEEFLGQLGDIVSSGRYLETEEHRPMGATELKHALLRTRMRKKQSHWEEHLLETRLHYAKIEERVAEVRRMLQEGSHAEARSEVLSLVREAQTLSSRYDPLKMEIEALSHEVEVALARKEAGELLAQAEVAFIAQLYPEVGAFLESARVRMSLLPVDPSNSLFGDYQRLADRYDASHRAPVELLGALRKSVVQKVQEKYREIHERHGRGEAVDVARLMEQLSQVTMAEKNLGTIERDKVGPAAYDRTKEELAEQRDALADLLRRLGPA
ncbi:MAG: protein kinase [Planctomycetes bacterium]|nr:protein kinase [Planctomycetota bacterium]